MYKRLVISSIFLINILFLNLFTQPYQEEAYQENQKAIINYNLKVNNKTDTDIFVATYYRSKIITFSCKIWGNIYNIKAGSSTAVPIPPLDISKDRKIMFTTNAAELKSSLAIEEYSKTPHAKISNISGENFYIINRNNLLKGFNGIEWNIIKPVEDIFTNIKTTIVDEILKKLVKHNHVKDTASVRIESNIPKEENGYIIERKKLVKSSLEKLLGMKIDDNKVPTIALCFSGGGYRALISSLGHIVGAYKTGLLDSISYISTLSGSTWMLAPWTTLNLDPVTLKNNLKLKATMDPFVIPNTLDAALENLISKFLYKQDISLIDFYGIALANRLLGELGHQSLLIGLSETAKTITPQKYPLPIYTAYEGWSLADWFEFTPYEVGSAAMNCYIPTWALGRTFLNGKSTNFAREQSFGYLMGTFGSAFAFKNKDFMYWIKDRLPQDLYNLGLFITDTFEVGDYRFNPAKFANYSYGIAKSPIKNVDQIVLIDAGMNCGLPMAPLLRPERKIDIIIACDASGGPFALSVWQFTEYAKNHGIKLPPIDYDGIETNPIKIFKDQQDPNVPVIIYLPLVKNDPYSTTFDPKSQENTTYNCGNFIYDNVTFENLCSLTEFNTNYFNNIILSEIKEVIQKK